MHTDDDFLRQLLESPADDTARLVYADWLDEQADATSQAKAEFLRQTVRRAALGKKQRQKRKLIERQLQESAANLDTDWLAVVSRLKIENCTAKREGAWETRYGMVTFEFVCDKRWDELTATNERTVRHCDSCRQKVHYCDTITVARDQAQQGHCIAVDLGVIRHEGDLDPPRLVLGMPGPDFYRREEERLKPDPVSAERERRKQAVREGGQVEE